MAYSGSVRLIHSIRVDASGIVSQDGGFSNVDVLVFPGVFAFYRLTLQDDEELGDIFIATTDGAVPQLVTVGRTVSEINIICFTASGNPSNPILPVSLQWYRVFRG